MVCPTDNNANADSSMNEWANFWRNEIGVNVLPADTRNKKPIVPWKRFEKNDVTEELHQQWLDNHLFEKGIAILCGPVRHNERKKGICLNCIDLDNELAKREFCNMRGVQYTLEELAERGDIIVEQHADDKTKAHVYVWSKNPFMKKSATAASDPNIPRLEVKGKPEDGLMFVTASVHKNGCRYEFIGKYLQAVREPVLHDEIINHINEILNKYGITYLNGKANRKNGNLRIALKNNVKVHEGARHDFLLSYADSTLRRLHDTTPSEIIKKMIQAVNLERCEPSLDDKEVNQIWDSALKFISEQVENEGVKSNSNNGDNKRQRYSELEGNIYYQINEKPERYIVAYRQKNKVIEVASKSQKKEIEGIETIEKYLVHKKTYLACMPIKIIRHNNPLTFLEATAKYSITFIDSVGETHIFKHKTLAEIVQCLRDLACVISDGADMALAAMVQAFKENKLVEDNEEIEYIGFFTNKHNNIIASNTDIVEPNIEKLADAIGFLINELKPRYENRLDLLATAIVWGIVAPVIFMLKTNNYFLKALHLYGFANSTKSNTGKIILALDGHQEDSRFALQFSRIDTPARLGEAVSKSTFPILVDEVNLSDEKNSWLINALKITIESRISRTKFATSKASSPTDIPSLSCLILTSNSAPPFHDSAYMRRVIARNHPQSETWREDDPKAVEFKEFLRINLPRLKALGDFRNWYIMNNQHEILDEKRPAPLDLGLKILKAAFEYAGIEIPTWLLEERLPENQLEESIQDNDVIVKRAFEKYIDEQINRSIQIWRLKLGNDEKLELPEDISDRLVKLAESNLLPDVKKSKTNFEVIIRKGILTELYNHGVTRDQLPNLKALADYMKANYRKSDGKMVIAATMAELTAYFDTKNE